VYGPGKGIRLNNWKSGAYLAWEYFHPGTEVPMLIKHIDDRDRWRFEMEGTKAFQKALWSYAPWTFEQWSEWLESLTWNPDAYRQFIAEGEAILRAHDQNVQSVVKGASRACAISTYYCPASGDYTQDASKVTLKPKSIMENYCQLIWEGLSSNCPSHLTSDVGQELANRSGTFGLCWTLANEGLIAKCSLRSNGDYDVSSIAKSFGGGGHLRAAGFEVPIETLLGWMK